MLTCGGMGLSSDLFVPCSPEYVHVNVRLNFNSMIRTKVVVTLWHGNSSRKPTATPEDLPKVFTYDVI